MHGRFSSPSCWQLGLCGDRGEVVLGHTQGPQTQAYVKPSLGRRGPTGPICQSLMGWKLWWMVSDSFGGYLGRRREHTVMLFLH